MKKNHKVNSCKNVMNAKKKNIQKTLTEFMYAKTAMYQTVEASTIGTTGEIKPQHLNNHK